MGNLFEKVNSFSGKISMLFFPNPKILPVFEEEDFKFNYILAPIFLRV